MGRLIVLALLLTPGIVWSLDVFPGNVLRDVPFTELDGTESTIEVEQPEGAVQIVRCRAEELKMKGRLYETVICQKADGEALIIGVIPTK